MLLSRVAPCRIESRLVLLRSAESRQIVPSRAWSGLAVLRRVPFGLALRCFVTTRHVAFNPASSRHGI